jgi:hypothetical protein
MLSSESINTLLSPHDAIAITMIRCQNGATTSGLSPHRNAISSQLADAITPYSWQCYSLILQIETY